MIELVRALLRLTVVRMGLVISVTAMAFIAPFVIAYRGPWIAVLIPPALTVLVTLFAWLFDIAIQWAMDGEDL